MIKEILLLGNPQLYEKSEPLCQEDLEYIKEVAKDLHDTLLDFRARHGAGRAIAAPQIGVRKRLIYMCINEPVVFINPVLCFHGEEMMEVLDDCMSFPDLLVKVKRYKHCSIKYKDIHWQDCEMKLDGDLSELLQHEYDHLDGIVATMRAIDNNSLYLKSQRDFYKPRRTKKIGILGGISLASTIQYYKTITDMYYSKCSDYYYPEIVINSLDFQYFTDMENENRKEEYIRYIVNGINNLKNAGADFVIMAANSPHSVYEEVKGKVDIEIISIVEATAKKAQELNLKKVLLTGIKYTMQGNFYQNGFSKHGIEVIVPDEEHQDEINDIIFKELVVNNIKEETRARFIELIKGYDVEGVILGCTELPLLLKAEDTELKLLDTLELHCKETLQYAMS